MSHRYSGPDFGFPRGDARLDFTDWYACPKQERGAQTATLRRLEGSQTTENGEVGHLILEEAARTLLPDLLSYDAARPASFPDNGRTLTDDAFDSFLCILTNGRVTEDGVGPHHDLIPEFPYVGPPHRAA